jgi:hypothetical protein
LKVLNIEGYSPDVNYDTSPIITNNITNKKYYHTLGMYAVEDPLDQVVCKFAKYLGFDTVILTNMIGSHQIVSEVLDTRLRAQSFNSLIFTN